MEYVNPSEAEMCVCPNALAATFCSTGHSLECHFPLTCDMAACSHLEKYGFNPELVATLEGEALTRLAAWAAPDCEKCGGKGYRNKSYRVTVTVPNPVIPGDIAENRMAVCSCIVDDLLSPAFRESFGAPQAKE